MRADYLTGLAGVRELVAQTLDSRPCCHTPRTSPASLLKEFVRTGSARCGNRSIDLAGHRQ
jgi:hypothetical protein